MKPYYENDGVAIYNARAEDILKNLPDDSINLIATDPPYFRVKDEPWDRQWDDAAAFLDWIGGLCEQWRRVLKPNGSLYVFASPQMSARVECKISDHFSVLNNIRWEKREGWHKKANKEELRSYLSPWESCIFAEQFCTESVPNGEHAYLRNGDKLRGFVFEPLRSYLEAEMKRAGLTVQDVAEAWRIKTGATNRTGMAGHWFSPVQWAMPTLENYEFLRQVFNARGGEYLRREYEDLRREYEDLRRPFFASPHAPSSDVWNFATVLPEPGKHPCEKPLEMMRHIIRTSSRPDDTVLDCFMGSGTTAVAATELGREFIGVELSEHWCNYTERRLWQPSLYSVDCYETAASCEAPRQLEIMEIP